MTTVREYIECGACGARSYHPKDIAEKFCGACRKWHANASEYELGAIADPSPPTSIAELLKLPNIVELDAQLPPPPDFEDMHAKAYRAKLGEAVQRRMLYIAMHKEHLLEAWIAETGVPPSDATLIMVEHFDPDRGMVTELSVERADNYELIREGGRLEMLDAVLHELGRVALIREGVRNRVEWDIDKLIKDLADRFRAPGFGGRK